MEKLKAVARGLCPPVLWNLAQGIRRRYFVPDISKPVWKKIHGVEILLPPSHSLPSIVANAPRYDTVLPEFLQFLRDEQETTLMVVDVGANVGDTAALAAAKLGAANVRFICSEADEQYLPFLKANTISRCANHLRNRRIILKMGLRGYPANSGWDRFDYSEFSDNAGAGSRRYISGPRTRPY